MKVIINNKDESCWIDQALVDEFQREWIVISDLVEMIVSTVPAK